MKKSNILSNFTSNIILLLSTFIAFLMLSITKSIRIKFFLGLIFLAIIFYSFFHKRDSIKETIKLKSFRNMMLPLSFSSLLFIDFYYCLSNVCPNILQEFLFNFPNITVMIIGFFGCIVGFYSIYVFSQYLLAKFIPIIYNLKEYKNIFIVTLFIYIVALIPLFRSNFYYVDDLGRVVEGYDLTGKFSRYVSSFLSTFLHSNTWLTDISPLTQIVATILLAVTGVIIIYIVSDITEKKGCIISAIALVPLGISPYFLSCLSYKYDSPYMALSILSAILPVLFYKRAPFKYALAVFAGTIIVCTTYQASSGIFPMVVVLMTLLIWNKKRDYKFLGKFILSSLCGYVSGLMLFRIVLMTPLNDTSYIESDFGLQYCWQNIKSYFGLVLGDFNSLWILLIMVIVISFIISVTMLSKQNKVLTLILTTVSVTIMCLLSFGTYIIFKTPLTEPRAMYGFFVFVCLMAVVLFNISKINVGTFASVALSWFIFVFSFTYGNALSVQKEYVDFKTEQIVYDICSTEPAKSNNELHLQITGTAGLAPSVENMSKEYGVLKRSVRVLLGEDLFGHYKLSNYYDLDIVEFKEKDLTKYNLPIIKTTKHYVLKGEDKYILVELNS